MRRFRLQLRPSKRGREPLVSTLVLAATLSCIAGTAAAQIAHWPGDNSPVDVIGGNNLTLLNGAGYTSSAISGQAFVFDGSNDYAPAGTPYSFAVGEDFSVALWAKPVSTTSIQDFLIDTRQGQFLGWSIYRLPSGKIGAGGRCDNAAIVGGMQSTTIFENDDYHHVAITLDWAALEWSLYVDGCQESVISNLASCNGFTASDKFHVGHISSVNPIYGYNGTIDELQIHDKVLSASEIRQIILESGGTPACLDPVVPVLSAQGLLLLSGSLLGAGCWLRRYSRVGVKRLGSGT